MMKLLFGAVLCFALFTVPIDSLKGKATEVFHWKNVDFAWKKPEDRAAAIASGEFVPANNLPLGLEVWKNKLFVTIPRWKNGVLSTLNYVNLEGNYPHTREGSSTSPVLMPYPSFEENRVVPNSTVGKTTVVSVFRVWADNCDRLWVLDSGVADILGNTKVHSKPKILIYDLNTDKLLKVHEFKDSEVEMNSLFVNINVDSDPKHCDKAYAYIPDPEGSVVISYNLEKDMARKIKHNYFHFDPLSGNMVVGGVNFQWTDGVFSFALTKPMANGYRNAFFHALASTKEFLVSTEVLKKEDSMKDSFYDYKVVGDKGPNSQTTASYIHEDTGVMFYTQLQKDGVNCWNTNKPLTPENLVEVASDNETMVFTNDLKVSKDGKLWMLTDKLPVFIYKGLDENEVNYRIFTVSVEDAIAGTNCAP